VKYYCKHWHIKFPSQRQMGESQTPIIGEIHIVHQKSDGRATSHLHQDGLAIVVIPLVLPYEGSSMSKSEAWFDENFGTLPVDGASKPLPSNFSLNVFKEQLNGSYYEFLQTDKNEFIRCRLGPYQGVPSHEQRSLPTIMQRIPLK